MLLVINSYSVIYATQRDVQDKEGNFLANWAVMNFSYTIVLR
jgi:hypothetical protein